MIKLNIDRIILNGFNISPSRAENIKSLIQSELESKLSQNHSLNNVRDKVIHNFNASTQQMNESASDNRLSKSIANSIMSSINTTSNRET